MEPLTMYQVKVLIPFIGVLLASVSQVRPCHYQGYLDGNQNRGHITEMMDIHFAVRIQANITVPHLRLAMS